MPISGGANNLLYRATRCEQDYAIKFTIRDNRNRARREYQALSILKQHGLKIAPQPVYFNPDRFRQPVVVQTWLGGEVLSAPPELDAEWTAFLQHYCAIHSLTPADNKYQLEPAVMNAQTGVAGKQLIYQHVKKLPPEARPGSLLNLLARFDTWTPPNWAHPPLALCRVDPNSRNFIKRPDGWASVDWENSGWGDPAFELADLITHPAYETVSPERWEWVIEAYTARRQDASAKVRIRTYYTVMLMWWVIRWARYLYEIPRGLDPRLVRRSDNWHEDTERKYIRYIDRLEDHLDMLFAL